MQGSCDHSMAHCGRTASCEAVTHLTPKLLIDHNAGVNASKQCASASMGAIPISFSGSHSFTVWCTSCAHMPVAA